MRLNKTKFQKGRQWNKQPAYLLTDVMTDGTKCQQNYLSPFQGLWKAKETFSHRSNNLISSFGKRGNPGTDCRYYVIESCTRSVTWKNLETF